MFDIRRRDEADGESKMMGSERLEAGVEANDLAGAGKGRDGIGFCPGRADEFEED